MVSEQRKEQLLRSLEKLEAYQEIQNEMGRMTAALNFRQPERMWSFFSSRPDISLECADEGMCSGREAVRAAVFRRLGGPAKPGEMVDMQLTTPMVEVAGDMQTAKAVWWCPGAGSIARSGRDPQAVWLWGMVAVDFVREDGAWKVWHLHYFRLIKCDYQKGWVEDFSMENSPEGTARGPVTYHNPYTPYSVRVGIPACPAPYETYDGPDWMLKKCEP